jgi:hypothetical protein
MSQAWAAIPFLNDYYFNILKLIHMLQTSAFQNRLFLVLILYNSYQVLRFYHNIGKLILLFLWSDTWLVSGKSCSSWRRVMPFLPEAGKRQLRSGLSVNALYVICETFHKNNHQTEIIHGKSLPSYDCLVTFNRDIYLSPEQNADGIGQIHLQKQSEVNSTC